jgi:hypothetical protein
MNDFHEKDKEIIKMMVRGWWWFYFLGLFSMKLV